MGKTSIEWADKVWNPIRGCTRVSPGCVNCYAEIMAARFSGPGMWGEGVAEMVRNADGKMLDHRWTGKIVEVPEKLEEPLHWKEPARIFVNSTSDLFHEGVSDAFIAAIFWMMTVCQHHTFLILTKRPERMKALLSSANFSNTLNAMMARQNVIFGSDWSLPNVWLGISVEDQFRFDERWPHLAATPAAKRFISYEPALGLVDFGAAMQREAPAINSDMGGDMARRPVRVDQIIIGGESGPCARDFHAEWAISALAQCNARGVAAYMKQMGARPFLGGKPMKLIDKKGGDMEEWPPLFRKREMP